LPQGSIHLRSSSVSPFAACQNLLEIAIAGARQLSEQAGREIPLYAAVFSDQRTEGKCRLYRRHLKPMGELFYSAGEAA
jgi:hypothetical protein